MEMLILLTRIDEPADWAKALWLPPKQLMRMIKIRVKLFPDFTGINIDGVDKESVKGLLRYEKFWGFGRVYRGDITKFSRDEAMPRLYD